MSCAKFMNSLSDEHNKDLQKQIGCMNGIFQIFDRHHSLSSSRRIVAHNQNPRIPSGRIRNQKTEHPENKSQKSTEKNVKPVKEKQRNSTESSRSSFSSSSCSSSFSSADCSRLSHLDSAKSSFGHISIPETPCINYNPNASLHSSQQSIDLRDFVKDFIQRDARTISIKHETKEEESGGGQQMLKYMDSPRPSHNIREAPNWKDVPRFSYDGRESRDKLKSNAAKLREHPRLSLDSRERSMKQCRLLGSSIILDQQQELGSHKRSSSVVAKLMGLEALPDSEQIDVNQTQLSGVSASPRNSYREPELRIPDLIKKSKFSIEPAPWRQADGGKSPRKPISKCQGSKSPLSVYGEIEKRLADLEFKKSGKDLRALKQILAAMQKTKELLETRKEEQVLNISLNQSSKAAYLQSVSSVSQTTKAAGLKSPIVIIKPAKHLEKVNAAIKPSMRRLRIGSEADNRKEIFNQQRTRDLSPRTNHRTSQTTPPSSVKVNSGRASGTLRPRLQQHRKLEFENEKRSRPPTPSSESSRMRKPPNSRQPISSGSPRRSSRPKSQTLQDELQHGNKEQSPEARFINEKLVAGPARGVVEQPSPISVLDAPFDGDESPSPVKKILNAFKGESFVYDETEWTPQDINYSFICRKPNLRAATDHRNVEQPTPDFLQLLDAYEATNPHHRYILEILIASGLIRDLESTNSTIKPHSTGCLIDPKLFLSLEQRNASSTNIAGYRQTIQKALVFDVANEILYRKLVLEDTPAQWFSSSSTLAGKRPKGKQLLEDLCSEINHLETNCSMDDEDKIFNNMLEKSTDWRSDLVNESSGVVLDIERLIFKDLISEVLTSVVADKQRGQHCRQLFSK